MWELAGHLIIPYLDPVDIASISSTCKALNSISKSITSTRISDACVGLERYPIPFINSIDSQLYPFFIYTPFQTLPSARSRDPFLFRVEGATGCRCRVCGSGCACGGLECGPGCACGEECGNRVTQSGVAVKLKVVKDGGKGWGLYADEFIPKGKFICEYTGELLTTEEARKRQKQYDKISNSCRFSHALLVVKEHLPSGNVCMRINIDATRIGNISRFINHSCDGGNLSTMIVRSSGALLPRVCFFSSKNILENEELTFSYGEIVGNPTGPRCFCGSVCCRGILPSEHT